MKSVKKWLKNRLETLRVTQRRQPNVPQINQPVSRNETLAAGAR
jgi:hypothetical protein